MKLLRRLMPSMFQRRLVLLMVVSVCAIGVLWAQLARLTVVQGATLLQQAERKMIEPQPLPTVRGDIIDRRGRVLATDRPCFDVRVDYRVITGQWAYDRARSDARADARRDSRMHWNRLSLEQQERLIEEYRRVYDEQVEHLWQTLGRIGGVDRQDIEDRKVEIVERVQTIRAHSWGVRQESRTRLIGKPVSLEEVAQPIREERDAHTILPAVSDEVAYQLQELTATDQYPGLRIERARVRDHLEQQKEVAVDPASFPSPLKNQEPIWIPVGQVGATLIGSMRDVWAEDVQRRPYRTREGEIDLGGYRDDGDRVGATGIEAAEEDHLRGLRGLKLIHHDTGQVERQPPTPGRDVQLTIDIDLQARIMALMDPGLGLMRVQPWHHNKDTPVGRDLYGAAVVLDVASGEILAMVSTPVPARRTPGEPGLDPRLDPNLPHLNKVYQAVYEPGSTIKPIIYAIAASQRAIQWNQVIHCKGHYLEGREDILRCWIYRPQFYYDTHRDLDSVAAIARSCNIYFLTCGSRLGPRRLMENLRQWGFFEPLGFGLPAEERGLAPDPTDPAVAQRMSRQHIDAMIGMGQGVAAPPLQIAAAHAALARGGVYLSPLLVRDRAHEQVRRELNIPPRVLDNVKRGMYESANNLDIGTASYIRMEDGRKERIINFPDVTVRAKTGTAETPPQYPLIRRINDGGQEMIVPDFNAAPLRAGTHSWYVMHVEKPGQSGGGYVVAVMVEYGGSGGRVAGPVANQILYALAAEGYF